jgi:hypothetical protein
MTDRPPVADLIADLAARLGVPRFVEVCTDLLGGAERGSYVDELRGLVGHDYEAWQDYWVRTWGARGLLHVWDDSATDAIVAGLVDPHWRPAEMCLKVAARHEVAGTGDGAGALADHELPRVRAQAMRALAVTGDSEHVFVVQAHLDDEDADVRRQAGRALTVLERR